MAAKVEIEEVQLSGRQAAKVLGSAVSYRMLDYWDRVGLLTPAVPANGSGSSRGYRFWDLMAARCLGRMVEMGLKVEEARLDRVVKFLQRIKTWPHGARYLVWTPDGVVVTKALGDITRYLSGVAVWVVFDLVREREGLEMRLEDL